jgi:cell division protein FtsL
MNTRTRLIIIGVLLVTVLASAMVLVSVRQINRLSFYELQKLERQRDDLNIEWRQLMAEFSTWRLEHNIENEVRGEYKMAPPGSKRIQTIRLAARYTESSELTTLDPAVSDRAWQ